MGFFKFESTKRVNAYRNVNGAKLWQRGYYDHVIRNARSLFAIREYIAGNPARWAVDAENPAGTASDVVNVWVQGLTLDPGTKGGETPPLQGVHS